jgi:hypothetical protein
MQQHRMTKDSNENPPAQEIDRAVQRSPNQTGRSLKVWKHTIGVSACWTGYENYPTTKY